MGGCKQREDNDLLRTTNCVSGRIWNTVSFSLAVSQLISIELGKSISSKSNA